MNAATTWIGRTIFGSDDNEVGRATAVLADDATGLPEWIAVSTEAHGGGEQSTRLVPLTGAVEIERGVRVTFAAELISRAPLYSSQHVEPSEERVLYEHYGISYSTEASPTGLPVSESDEVASTSGVSSTAAEAAPVSAATVPPVTDDTMTGSGLGTTGTTAEDTTGVVSSPTPSAPPVRSVVVAPASGTTGTSTTDRVRAAAADPAVRRKAATYGAAALGVVAAIAGGRAVGRRRSGIRGGLMRALYATRLRKRPPAPVRTGAASWAADRYAQAAEAARRSAERSTPALRNAGDIGKAYAQRGGQAAARTALTGVALGVMGAQKAGPAAARIGGTVAGTGRSLAGSVSGSASQLSSRTSGLSSTVAARVSETLSNTASSVNSTASKASSKASSRASKAGGKAGTTVANVGTRASRLSAKASKKSAKTGAKASGRASKAVSGLAARARPSRRSVKIGRRGSRHGVHAVTAPLAEGAGSVHKAWRRFMGKVTAALGFGIGYVLGARAGRERYEVIASKANELLQRPEVQQAQQKVKATVGDRFGGQSSSGSSYGAASGSSYDTPSSASYSSTGTSYTDVATPSAVVDPVAPLNTETLADDVSISGDDPTTRTSGL